MNYFRNDGSIKTFQKILKQKKRSGTGVVLLRFFIVWTYTFHPMPT